MSETDSFIEEVSDEVRRDKLFALYRKYGWIAGVIVVLVVGAASYNEWRKHTEIQAAQGFGYAIMTALTAEDVAKRSDAIALVAAPTSETQAFLDLLQAAAKTEARDRDGALALLDGLAANPDAPQTYRSLAELKAVMLRGASQDRTARLAVLDKLATPGNPFRALAIEQKALALYEFGETDAALGLLLAILEEPEVSQGLLERSQQLIVALGGTVPQSPTVDPTNG